MPMHLFILQNDQIDRSHVERQLKDQYGLAAGLFAVTWLESTSRPEGFHPQRVRDLHIAQMADLILPVSIRPRGWLATLLKSDPVVRGKLNGRFCVPYEHRSEPLGYRIDTDAMVRAAIPADYLWHYTRTRIGCWPDERICDFWGSVAACQSYPRSALHTLRKIVSSKTIIAAERHYSAGHNLVAFTSNSPALMSPLMRWRARYGEMAFEPYAVGFPRSAASSLGIFPVAYADTNQRETATASRWLHQSIGRITDWRSEREFRHRGDFDLRRLDSRDLILLTRYDHEACLLQSELQVRTIGLTHDLTPCCSPHG